MTPTRRLHTAGQSLWLDNISRSLITGGRLARYLEEDGLRGMTSNPSIFEKAIAGSDDYDDQLTELLAERPRLGAERLYELLAIDDIRAAADALAPVFEESGGDDGYVSLEVSPYLAYDTAATIDNVRRLWDEVDRANLMVKVPATDEGIPAIETLIGEGINVNVTLMFSLADYEAVAQAYLAGLRKLDADGDHEALARVASVASFFVSRVDGKVDPRLDENGSAEAKALRGEIAIANSKRAYHRFQELFLGDGFADLAAKGARVQRVLWGSTSTKDPDYSDVLYVEELIGPHTVNTVPPKTIDAFRDHGEVRETVTEGQDEAADQLAALADLGIDLDRITSELQREGVASFADSFDTLLAAIEGERRRILADGAAGRQQIFLGRALGDVSRLLQEWGDEGFGRRLWAGDRTLWSAEPVDELNDRLGWLTLPDSAADAAEEIAAFADQMAEETDRVFLLGMGGSSLAPEVFQRVFGGSDEAEPGRPTLTVVDSTHPQAVAAAGAAAAEAGWERVLVVVSSKSGGTVETLSLFRWFWARAVEALGEEAAGRRFVAVTDPGSKLEALARERRFRALFTAPPEVGGRYSALTPFGLVPAALVGVDPATLLDRARGAAFAFGPDRPALVNEALYLGGALGELAYGPATSEGGGGDGDGGGG
ncbi:MAG TPA: bifunctional transaldolase/phosoglucose isomerase, partial [Thermoanaerobaculia bacterium]|nr:bifunctional transaldolase/phosoglucose isomerase [Thermoanaerobaculia bacterium]